MLSMTGLYCVMLSIAKHLSADHDQTLHCSFIPLKNKAQGDNQRGRPLEAVVNKIR